MSAPASLARDRDWGLLVAVGIGVVCTVLVAVGVVVRWDGPSTATVLIVGPGLGLGAAVAARIGWFLGDLTCALVGRPTAGERQLVVAPIRDGQVDADAEVVVIDAAALTRASIRSEAADGTVRRPTNGFDDTITVIDRSGRTIELVLPHEPPRIDVESGTGGPPEIRAWIRRHATTYV